ncbi:hypothetical protein EJB05_33738 [Eragrostis curvula]|uniref:RING-type E3 ubiquitin transferase n=1 Tax=Eragrostis curvula TaxID=38414 RepID=A0A5J9U388_9POAL|nr:hypothetical protein EJB05_33738 [Eragrostis curvula]
MEPWKDFDFDDDVDSGSSGSAAVPPTSGGAGLKGAAVAYVMAEDADALDCGICCLPLKPPIFQCNVGHVVCSPCHNKLMGTGKCHLCGINVAGGYRRCHAMERLVESIRVPCPNATDGCTAMPAYCHQQSHRQACPHAPYSCPGKNCGFIGYMNAGLLDHFSGTHGWPCTTKKNRANKTCRFSVGLNNNGFNFLIADLATAGEGGSATITSSKYLFLLNVLQKPLGRAISVLLIGRKPSSKAVKCVLTFSHIASEDRKFLGSHLLQSKINVECSDLCSGVPNPDDCFQFVVPDYLLGEGNRDSAIKIKVNISIDDLE